jgi:plastocyanin
MREPARRRSVFVAATLLGLLALSRSGLAVSRDVVLEIYHDTFRPRNLLITKGDTVVFRYMDVEPGAVLVLADGSRSSPPLDQYQSWAVTFWQAGRYDFYLSTRPSLRGSIRVR